MTCTISNIALKSPFPEGNAENYDFTAYFDDLPPPYTNDGNHAQ